MFSSLPPSLSPSLCDCEYNLTCFFCSLLFSRIPAAAFCLRASFVPDSSKPLFCFHLSYLASSTFVYLARSSGVKLCRWGILQSDCGGNLVHVFVFVSLRPIRQANLLSSLTSERQDLIRAPPHITTAAVFTSRPLATLGTSLASATDTVVNSLNPRAEHDRSSVRTSLCSCCCIYMNGTSVNRLLPQRWLVRDSCWCRWSSISKRLGLAPLSTGSLHADHRRPTCQPSPASLLDTYSIIYKRRRSSKSSTLCLLRARNVLISSLVSLCSALHVRISFIPPAAAPIFCFVVPALVVSLTSLVLPSHPQFAILSLSILHPLPTAWVMQVHLNSLVVHLHLLRLLALNRWTESCGWAWMPISTRLSRNKGS